MTEKDFDIRDSIIESLREDVKFAELDARFAAVTAFFAGVLVGVIAAGALIYGF